MVMAVYYADIPVGAICCKYKNLSKGSKEPPTLVILTLASVSQVNYSLFIFLTFPLSILAPYRSLSLGTSLLRSAMYAAIHPTIPPPPIPSDKQINTRAQLTVAAPRVKVNRALAHVQVGNDEAKRFYERLGFKEVGM